ncbi:MAG: TIGR03032 family protein [Pseudomonadota bacterium]
MQTDETMTAGTEDGAEQAAAPQLELQPSRTFAPWLASTGASIGFTTYQAGKIFLIGSNAETGRLSIFERSFPRCMGLGAGPDGTLWLSSLYQLWRFENFLDPGQVQDGYDAVFVPLEGRTTGDVDIHDVHPLGPGRPPVFVVTRFNCLATLDRTNSFAPVWKPPFIDRIAAEDRCHLNGLAMRDGRPAYVTCVSRTNIGGGWREHRESGGVVLDVDTGEAVATGLSMPHSPRLYGGQLYVIQSGAGEFGRIDLASGMFEPMCFLPGFARGVTFIGRHAIIGVSRPRREGTFEGLAVEERLAREGVSPVCRLAVVNLDTGDVEHSLDIEGAVQELYDVTALPGIRRPTILGFRTPEIRFMLRPAPLTALP